MNQLGYYGKTPHRGDFVRYNLPQTFINVWDDWLQQVIVLGEQQIEDDWATTYNNAPSYRFVLSSGIAGNEVWLGLLVPSQDKVGRRFPFCLAMSLAESALPCVSATALLPWFEDAEALLARVLSNDYEFHDLQSELAEMANKHAQSVSGPGNPVSTVTDHAHDTLCISVPTSTALRPGLATPALLDTVLRQTVSEYSIWMSCNHASEVTVVNAGLPQREAGLALFTTDWESGATAQIELGTLAQSIGAGLTQFSVNQAAQNAAQGAAQDTANDTSAEHDETIEPTINIDAIEAPPTDSNTGTSTTDRPTPAQSDTPKQIPSTDDWAALEGFEGESSNFEKLLVPEVEPLELDEDDLPDAPWEN